MTAPSSSAAWPALPYADWKDTLRTLHLMSQIVGKVRVRLEPWLNHSWHSALYVTARGLTTGLMPHPARPLELELDLVDRCLRLLTDEAEATVALEPTSMAAFHARVTAALHELGTPVRINTHPNEIPDAVPFDQDHAPRAYDGEAARRFLTALQQADRVLKRFRTGFLGKASPVHFFWGSFDLAVTRFSGRRAPLHPGGVPNLPDTVAREAYSHEVSSCGFWPGGPGLEEPVFYAYAYPEPDGFRQARIRPDAARYETGFGEFVLPYEAVRRAADADAALMAFLTSTYETAADLGGWDRAGLECRFGEPGRPRLI